jgi:hypothetical protein
MAEAYGLELERVSNKFIDEKLQAKKSTNFEKVAMFEEEIEKEAKAESQFRKLQDNKVSLTPEERKQCLDAKAVWHYNGGGPTPAVWKSINKETGEVTYVTHTHRAYNTAPTLKGAIGRFHKFIKGTA